MLIKSKNGIHITWATRSVLFLFIYCLVLLNITVVTAKIVPRRRGNGRKILQDKVGKKQGENIYNYHTSIFLGFQKNDLKLKKTYLLVMIFEWGYPRHNAPVMTITSQEMECILY